MIVDLDRFAQTARPRWQRLETFLNRLENDPLARLSVGELETFHSLYQHACNDLARIAPLAASPALRRYLESLTARAYSEIHESRESRVFSFRRWFLVTFPATFRVHFQAFLLSLALTLLGSAFGVVALAIDPDAKSVLMPFAHLEQTPAERVAKEQADRGKHLEGGKSSFSAVLMTHNTQVAFTTLALGMTFATGTILILFYNGVILGAVSFDYIAGGQGVFLAGWLLPHGVIEIPAILIAGQAGLVLGHALIGWGDRTPRAQRVRAVAADLATLAGGTALMLVWAGVVEAFFSQYHEPVIPYAAKIAFGLTEAGLLIAFLMWSGRRQAA